MKYRAVCTVEGCAFKREGDSIIVTQQATRHELDQKKAPYRHPVTIEEIEESNPMAKYLLEMDANHEKVLVARVITLRRVQGDSLNDWEQTFCAIADGLKALDIELLSELAKPLTDPLHQVIDALSEKNRALMKEIEELRNPPKRGSKSQQAVQ